MAGAVPQDALHLRLEGFQQIQGHKSLDGTGKAAAVDPAGPPAIQQFSQTISATATSW